MATNNQSEDKSKNVISEATPVKVGFVILILSLGLGAFGSSIWFASQISSKLDQVISNISTVNSSISELKNTDSVFSQQLADFKLKIALQEVQVKAVQDKVNLNSASIKRD